ncbi:MAG TPA: M23 family metallopeptidase [Gemmatimonadales bacterium]
MPDARGPLARAANRGAMLVSIFVAGAILGWVASERDLLPPPPAPPQAPLLRAEGVAPEMDDSVAAGSPAAAAPAPRSAPDSISTQEPVRAGLPGRVPVGPPVTDDSGRSTPIPTRAELEALRAALAVPVAGVARSELRGTFDERRGGGERAHQALDIPAPRGTQVLSAASGRLLKLFTSDDGGLMVYASDPSGRFVLAYGHLDSYADGLREGMALRQGQPLGAVGTTGNAPRGVPHLHFAVFRVDDVATWWRGTPVDPYALLAP